MGGRSRKKAQNKLLRNGSGSVRNPMLDSVFLIRFFELCSSEDLANFRLVCKPWYELSLTRWRNNTMIEVMMTEDDDDNPLNEVLSKLHNGNEFNRLNLKPYKSFRLIHPFLERRNVLLQKSFVHLRRLELEFRYTNRCSVTSKLQLDVESLRRAIFVETPNLEYLSLQVSMWRFWAQAMESMKCRIEAAEEKYERLELAGSMLGDAVPTLLKTLEKLGKNKEHKMVIKYLNVCTLHFYREDEDEDEMMKSLVALKQMKLETFHFRLRKSEESYSVLSHALQLHGDSLKTLYLKNYRIRLYPCFPCEPGGLTSLTELHLDGSAFPNLHFLSQTPNLKILHIRLDEGCQIVKGTRLELETQVAPGVVELHFFNDPYEHRGTAFSPENVEILTRLMPNVKRFKAPLLTPALQVVIQNWKGLCYLDTFHGAVTDGIVTGRVIRKTKDLTLTHNLMDMKDLQVLIIEKGLKLTDESIHNGFLKMPHLHTLKVTLSEKVTEAAFKALSSRFPGVEQVPIPNKPSLRRGASRSFNSEQLTPTDHNDTGSKRQRR